MTVKTIQYVMKRLFLLAIAAITFASCSSNWEYKIVTVENSNSYEFSSPSFSVSSEDLNLFGEEGWELVDVYTIIETEHPNFGNSEYVTGIRENTRTQSLNYVFKRRK